MPKKLTKKIVQSRVSVEEARNRGKGTNLPFLIRLADRTPGQSDQVSLGILFRYIPHRTEYLDGFFPATVVCTETKGVV